MELLRPSSADDATAALGNGSVALAGGTELVPLLRDGLTRADTLVHIDAAVPRGIEGTRIGAGTTLAELEVDPQIPQALREACSLAASPQLRSMGTIGGNLLQATRCWYWRLGFDCWLHGGERCFAKDGAHGEHAIFANELCASAHPSDPAAALLALGATLHTTRRDLPVVELYRLPTADDRSTTTLAPDELILELDVPVPEASTYLKAMDRRKWAFPLVGVAAVRIKTESRAEPAPPLGDIASDVLDGIRIGLAGVAPIPWTLDGADALEDATPLPGTAYKVEIARALIRRALAGIADPGR
jgi:xanthine dehydrogenase YagS FAD-binding subunit